MLNIDPRGAGFDMAAPAYNGSDVDSLMQSGGFASVRRDRAAAQDRRVTEAARLYADALTGRVDPWLLRQAMQPTEEVAVMWLHENYPGLYGNGDRMLGLRETMSSTDYQALYVDVLDRMYYGYYNDYPVVNLPLVKQSILRDFRTVKRYLYDGLSQPWAALGNPASLTQQDAYVGPVPQNGSTFGFGTSTAAISYSPQAYGCSESINWQAFINDDLGIFNDASRRLAMKGNRGISKYITQQFFTTSGPSTTLFTTAYRNLITTANGASANNTPLGSQGLMDATKILAGQLDAGGDPILMQGRAYLVYGPKDVAIVKNLQNMLSVQVSVEGGSGGAGTFPDQFVQVSNWLMGNLTPIMDPYLPIVASSATGSWMIVLDPNSVERPAVEMGFLKGFETPQLFRKIPNTASMSGAPVPEMGDFYNLAQEIKAIGVYGSAIIDGRCAVASNGSGS